MLIIGNGKLYTGGDNPVLMEDGALLVDGNKISKIGKTAEIKASYKDAEFIDAKGMLIMPGLSNTHEHIYSAFARGLSIPGNPPQNFLEILEGTWWNIDRKLDLDNTYYSAIATYIESIKNGVTFVSDHHASFGQIRGSLDAISRAAQLLGVRTCLAYEVSDRDGVDKRKESIYENIEFIKTARNNNLELVSALFGMHASFTLSDETLAMCRELNTENAGYHIHIAEGIYDEQHCKNNYKMSVVERLHKEGILGPDTVAGHCIHISMDDMDILKETNTSVIHNPESNMGNAVGAPDVISMLDKGIRVGLGTDGYTHDITESLKVANILQKHRRALPDRGFTEAISLLNNNYKIEGQILGKPVGQLKEGYLADIIIVDYRPNTPLKVENFAGHLMFGISGALTDTSIINGRLVMRHRELVGVDEEELLAKSRESAKRLWARF